MLRVMTGIILFCGLLTQVCAPNPKTQSARPRHVPLGLENLAFVADEIAGKENGAQVGRRLFFDPNLSLDESLACSSCHRPELAYSDGRRVPTGYAGREGIRNSPAIINREFGRSFFWDGRAQTVEEQVLASIQNPVEMNLPLHELVDRLKAKPEYVRLFDQYFGAPISSQTIAVALASFVRTLRCGDSLFDRFENGDYGALTEEEQEGLALFRGKGRCTVCHKGPNFTDEEFHNTGVSWGSPDLGRFKVSGILRERGAFKTPTLREVSRTAPYMHDGSMATLEQVVAYYNQGAKPNENLDRSLRPIGLTEREEQALVRFLRTLDGASEGCGLPARTPRSFRQNGR